MNNEQYHEYIKKIATELYDYLDKNLPKLPHYGDIYVSSKIEDNGVELDKQKFVDDYEENKIQKDKCMIYKTFHVTYDIYLKEIYANLSEKVLTCNQNKILTMIFDLLTEDVQEKQKQCTALIYIWIEEKNFKWESDTNTFIYVFKDDINNKTEVSFNNITDDFKKKITEVLVSKIQQDCYPFIVLDIGLFIKNKSGHANIIFIENGTKEIKLYYYEPHGTTKDSYSVKNNIYLVVEAFRIVIEKKTQIPTTAIYAACHTGLQSYLSEYDGLGNCALYIMFWIYINISIATTIRINQINKSIWNRFFKTPMLHMNKNISIGEEVFKSMDKNRLYNLFVRFGHALIQEYINRHKINPSDLNKIYQIDFTDERIEDFKNKNALTIKTKEKTAKVIYKILRRNYSKKEPEQKEQNQKKRDRSKTDRTETYEEFLKKAVAEENIQTRTNNDLEKNKRHAIIRTRKIGQPCYRDDQCMSGNCKYDQDSHTTEWGKEQKKYADMTDNGLSNEQLKDLSNIWNKKDQKYCVPARTRTYTRRIQKK